MENENNLQINGINKSIAKSLSLKLAFKNLLFLNISHLNIFLKIQLTTASKILGNKE